MGKLERRRAEAGPPRLRTRVLPFERWLARRRGWCVLAIVIVSVACRGVYFLQVRHSPLPHLHKWTETDMNYFHSWAEAVAAGDWLSRRISPPLHSWHQQVAEDYAREHGEEDRFVADQAAYARALWDRWCGGGRFYQDPLYPYLVALTFKVFGPDVRFIFAWQMLLGVGSNVLVYLLARECFGHVAAVTAAALAALHAPLMYFEMLLLRETLITFAGLALAWTTIRTLRRGGNAWWFLTGVAFGAAMLLKSTFTLVLLGIVAGLAGRAWRRGWARLRRSPGAGPRTSRPPLLYPEERDPSIGRVGYRGVIREVFFLGIGAATGFSPLVARNIAVGVSPLATAGQAAAAFAMFNSSDAAPVIWSPKHLSVILDESPRGLGAVILATLRTHENAGSYLGLLWGRFKMTWRWYESSDNDNFHYYRLHAPVLRWLPIPFLGVAPLAVVGCILAFSRWRRAWPLYALVLVSFIVLLVFSPLSRFRLPWTVALVPFAGLALAVLVRAIVLRQGRYVVAILVGAVLLTLGMANAHGEDRPLIRSADYIAPYIVYYDPQSAAAVQAGDWERAAKIYAESLAFQPPEVAQMGPLRAARSPYEAQLAGLYSMVYENHSGLLARAGRMAESKQQHRRAAELRDAADRGRPARDK